MLRKNLLTVLQCLFLLLAFCPRPGIFQNSPENDGGLEEIIRNILGFAKTGINFLNTDFRADITEELDDMTPRDMQTFDFVVVGAGSAGAAVASRLSEINNVTVLLIEAGVKENIIMDIPLMALYLQLTDYINWDYKFKQSPNYCRGMKNCQCNLPRGKVMGGCSVLNLMIATRAHHKDYDDWARLGCEGWAWDDVFPLFKKMENFEASNPALEPEYHSKGGLLSVELPPYHTTMAGAFLDAGQELGFPLVDYDGREMIGYSYTYATMKNGSRYSSNKAYLHPVKGRPNLFLTRESRADKVLIDRWSKQAYGVLFTKHLRRIRVRARKEVILCAGAIGSPQLLMLSGIGPANHLQEFNIPVIKSLPVGQNLMDHLSYWGLNFLVNDSVTVVTEELFEPTNTAITDYLGRREGPLTIAGGIEAAGFLNVDDRSARQGQPNMELIMTGISMGSDPLVHESLAIVGEHYEAYMANLKNKQSFMIVPTLLTPMSRGEVLLSSADPAAKPIIDPNYFGHPDDMRRMILGVRESQRLSQTQAMQKYDAKLPDNPIPGCEQFEKDSDGFWDCAIRTFADTLYHPSGTCKMGARNDSSAVVDPRLRVIGVKRLRVADASIMPIIVNGHTNVPTIMIGEKLAQMVKEDWGYLE